jgi:hypothetical protein
MNVKQALLVFVASFVFLGSSLYGIGFIIISATPSVRYTVLVGISLLLVALGSVFYKLYKKLS